MEVLINYSRFHLDLLHEVHQRSAVNLMNARNLTLVFAPNLLHSKNTSLDLHLCGYPDSSPNPLVNRPLELDGGTTTFGQIFQLCIERYYEVFDDIPDRTEALSDDAQELVIDHSTFFRTPSPSLKSPQSYRRDSMIDDDEDIDDAMLVMPLGPSASSKSQNTSTAPPSQAPPPSAWSASQGTSSTLVNPPYKPRVRPTHSNVASRDLTGSRSMHSATNTYGSAIGRSARSMISIEKYDRQGTVTARKGSITVGRGTSKKSSGSGVEAMGITASGFFAPPPSAPPVPSLPGR